MKTKKVLSVVFVLIVAFTFSIYKVEAQSLADFIKIIGGTETDSASSIVQTSDGGYAFAGTTASYAEPSRDIMISKLDSSGNEEWTKTIGGSADDYTESFIQSSDGGYVIAGYTQSYGGGDQDVLISKLNSSGIEQWTKIIGGASNDNARAITETSDGGYVVVGASESYSAGGDDLIAIKVNGSGVEQWTKSIGGVNDDGANAVVETSDGGYAIVGFSYNFGGTDSDILITKLNSTGIEQWTKTIGGTAIDYGRDLVETTDGSLVLSGYTFSYGGAEPDIIISKLNSSGVEQWTKLIGAAGLDEAPGLTHTSDGGFAVIGTSTSYGGSDLDVLISKLDFSGAEVWSKTIVGTGTDAGWAIVQTTDNGYAISATTQSYGGSDTDMMILKLDSLGSAEDCSTQISDETITEIDEVISEADETATETDHAVSETDILLAEVDIDPAILNECYTAVSEDTTGIEVNIAEVITLDCGADVDFGTVTPGTPVSAETTCTTTTNAETGYTLDIIRDDADTTMDHTTDATSNITDKTAWTGTGGTTATWTGTGIGFAVYASSTGSKNTTDWGNGTTCHDALNEYTGFPDTYQSILSHSSYSSIGTTTSVCYRVDVPSNQKSGAYDGVITYQVYSNP